MNDITGLSLKPLHENFKENEGSSGAIVQGLFELMLHIFQVQTFVCIHMQKILEKISLILSSTTS